MHGTANPVSRRADGRERPPAAVLVSLLLLVALVAASAVGCDGDAPSAGDETAEPVAQVGGTLRVGIEPVTNLDPHFATTASDILLSSQVYEKLVEADTTMQPRPALATEWRSSDASVWTFELRRDVRFHNGEAFTADDVVYSVERLRDPEIGSPLVGLLSAVDSVEADGDHTVVFTLTTPDAEFPSELSDHHAVMLCRNVEDPKEEWVGTGPFMLDGGITSEGVVVKRFDDYWRSDADGERLPYLDEVSFVVTGDASARFDAIRRGRLDVAGDLDPRQAQRTEEDERLRLLTATTNTFWGLHIRCDADRVGEDPRLRRALAAATDSAAIVEAVRPGLAETGNGTCVGPAYGPDYLDDPSEPEPEEARQLLTEAGHGDGLDIELTVPDEGEAPAIAAAWKKQMAAVGVTVLITEVPATDYYGDGEDNWLEVDFGLTDWSTRATPLTYFELAYEGGAPYNQSHWSDARFDELVDQISVALDDDERADLYRDAQTILREEVPVIVPYMEMTAAGTGTNVTGLELHAIWPRTRFDTVRFLE